ncbi:hypothetical protein CL616_00200 [archaeon]|nr:hypothetical protein [archaeon]
MKKIQKKDLDLPLSEELCEFVGVIIGDGFTNNYGHHYITQITSHRRLDREYLLKHIIPKSNKILNKRARIAENMNWIRINYYSKKVFLLLTQRFQIPKGKKSKTVKIPQEILNAKKELLSKTLRGIYDTDGYFYYDKRPMYKKPYPIIDLHMSNLPLLIQIKECLLKFNIKSTIRTKQTHLLIYGEKETNKFLENIGFKNQRHLSKITKSL